MAQPSVGHPAEHDHGGGYRHEVFVYRTVDEYLDFLTSVVRDGVAAGEPVLVAVPADRLAALRAALPGTEDAVRWADMSEVGDNPARILALWRDFLDGTGGSPGRGIGEPVHPGRDADQLEECLRHERLLNLAFDGHPFLLICPYDASTLADAVLDDARAAHPWVHAASRSGPSSVHRPGAPVDGLFDGPLPPPGGPVSDQRFEAADLGRLREFVGREADRAGLGPGPAADLVVAGNEIATNVVTHGGAGGTARCWRDGDWFVCEVEGPGSITDPFAGRIRPDPRRPGGRGLWLANQLCDLVQIRNTAIGCVVRLRSRVRTV